MPLHATYCGGLRYCGSGRCSFEYCSCHGADGARCILLLTCSQSSLPAKKQSHLQRCCAASFGPGRKGGGCAAMSSDERQVSSRSRSRHARPAAHLLEAEPCKRRHTLLVTLQVLRSAKIQNIMFGSHVKRQTALCINVSFEAPKKMRPTVCISTEHAPRTLGGRRRCSGARPTRPSARAEHS